MSASDLAVPDSPITRLPTTLLPPTSKTPTFTIDASNKSYKHQYANIYFVRLRMLRPHVQENAKRKWKEVAGDPEFVPRVLEVVKGKLSYVVGTVYLEMPLKPNVLEDIARDHAIPAPIQTSKYWSEDDSVMLEDESGRIRLVGERLKSLHLVTGVIMGVLGLETVNGDFEVIDFCFADMPPQAGVADGIAPSKSNQAGDGASEEWLAIVSGLDIGANDPPDAQLQLLSEYICGEACGSEDQAGASRISRLIVAGDSLAPQVAALEETDKKSRKYGQDTTSFSPHPLHTLTEHLTDMARSVPIHLLVGPSDPSGTILPQQALPRAMFGGASNYASFSTETNPTYLHIGPGAASSSSSSSTNGASTSKSKPSAPTRTVLVHSGQPIDDMAKYLPSTPTTRLSLAESTLRWRHIAPTAPDTLWCHPYFTSDPFVLAETPDIYIVGNQPEFKTKLVAEKRSDKEGGERRCRIVLVPRFKSSGMVVLVNLRTLAVRTVSFAIHGMKAGGEMDVDPTE